MKKVYVPILSLLLAFILFTPFTPKTHAAPAKPSTISCSTGCESWGEWNGGTTYGLYDSYQVSDQNMTQCSVCNYARTDVLNQQGNDTTSSIVVGLMKQNGLGGWCGSASNNKLYYVVQAFGSGGINDHIWNYCAGVPSADIGSRAAWKIAPYTSGGGGMLVQLFSVNYDGNVEGTSAFHIPYSYGVIHSASRIKRDEFFFGQPFADGHFVWGVSWLYAEWAQGNGNLVYITNGFTATHIVEPPVFFYWQTVPAPGNFGGQLNSCIYDSNSGCTIGG